jgi:cytochrome bd-type quinol oxidase subunit 1
MCIFVINTLAKNLNKIKKNYINLYIINHFCPKTLKTFWDFLGSIVMLFLLCIICYIGIFVNDRNTLPQAGRLSAVFK